MTQCTVPSRPSGCTVHDGGAKSSVWPSPLCLVGVVGVVQQLYRASSLSGLLWQAGRRPAGQVASRTDCPAGPGFRAASRPGIWPGSQPAKASGQPTGQADGQPARASGQPASRAEGQPARCGHIDLLLLLSWQVVDFGISGDHSPDTSPRSCRGPTVLTRGPR